MYVVGFLNMFLIQRQQQLGTAIMSLSILSHGKPNGIWRVGLARIGPKKVEIFVSTAFLARWVSLA